MCKVFSCWLRREVGAMGLLMEVMVRVEGAGAPRMAVRRVVEVRAVRAATDMMAVVLVDGLVILNRV